MSGDKTEKIWDPGFLGNILVGAVAAFVVWGLYGAPSPGRGVDWKLAGPVAGSLIVGIGGSRALTEEINKRLSSPAP